jgi:hypothetical protein
MALDNFIPEIWSAVLIQRLEKAFRYAQAGVANRDWEGEIRQKGDTVRINSIGPVTIFDYAKNTDMSAPEALTDAQTTLSITKSKAFNFAIDDIDKAQGNPATMAAAMQEAAFGLRDGVDQFIAAQYTDISSSNFIASDASPKTDLATAGKAYEYLVDLGVLLDNNDVPEEDRWVVIPPWYHGWLQKDARFVGNGTQANDDVLRNGLVGRAAGLNILVSRNVPATNPTTSYKVIAGHSVAWTFAQQVSEVEAYRPEKRFADAVKGLLLYGAKCTRPDKLAVLFANLA